LNALGLSQVDVFWDLDRRRQLLAMLMQRGLDIELCNAKYQKMNKEQLP